MPVEEQQHANLGAAVEWCLTDAWRVWKAQYCASLSHELAWTSECLKVTTECIQLHAGRVRVTVSVAARRPWRSDRYFYQFQQDGKKCLTLAVRS